MLGNNESYNILLSLVRIQWQCKANCVTLETCQAYKREHGWKYQFLYACFQNCIMEVYEHNVHVYKNCYIEFWKHVIILSHFGTNKNKVWHPLLPEEAYWFWNPPPLPPSPQPPNNNKLQIIIFYFCMNLTNWTKCRLLVIQTQ